MYFKIGDEIKLKPEDKHLWPELHGKKLTIWDVGWGCVFINIGPEKDFDQWDEDWFVNY
jgi:hypothetical protein